MKALFNLIFLLFISVSFSQKNKLDSLQLIVPTSDNVGDLDARKISYSNDGKLIALYGVKNKIKLFDLNSLKQVADFTVPEVAWVTNCYFSDDSRLIISSQFEDIVVFDIYNKQIIYNKKKNIQPNKDGKYLLQKNVNDSIQIIEKISKKAVLKFPMYPNPLLQEKNNNNDDSLKIKEVLFALLNKKLINENQLDKIEIEKINSDHYLANYNSSAGKRGLFIYNFQKKKLFNHENSVFLFSIASKWIVFEDSLKDINITSIENPPVVHNLKIKESELSELVSYHGSLYCYDTDSILVFSKKTDNSNVSVLNLSNFKTDYFEINNEEGIGFIGKNNENIYYTVDNLYYDYKLYVFDLKTKKTRKYYSKSLPGKFLKIDNEKKQIVFMLPKLIAKLSTLNLSISYEPNNLDYANTIDRFKNEKSPFYFENEDGISYCKDSQGLRFKLIFLENNNWLIKLPNSPYYMCSKDASKMLHYVTPSLKVIGFDQLDPIYNRPDIVLDSIGKYFAGGPDFKLIKQYREAWVKRMNRLGLDTASIAGNIEVPDVEIVNADQIEYNNTSGSLNFHFKASDAKHTLRRYNVYVNEVPLFGSDGISITEKVNFLEKDISLKLSAGDNKIQVSVMNDLGLESFRYPVYVQYQPTKPVVSNTYYIGIGVDSFSSAAFNLKYCVKDINDLGTLLAKDQHTKTVILKNKEVTKENVMKIKSLLQQTTEQDKVIISCSSHGLLDKNNNFYLAMHDVAFNKPEEKGLAYEDLQGLLDGIPARKKLLLLDACNSGENEKSDNNGLGNSKDLAIKQGAKGIEIESVSDSSQNKKNSFETMMELFVNVNNQTGATVISAAGGKQSAYEAVLINGKPISNGAFTYSIIEYLKQHANEKDKLTVNQLKQYTEQRVTEITNGKQKPTSRQETMEVDWGLY